MLKFIILCQFVIAIFSTTLNPVSYINALDNTTLNFRGNYFDLDTPIVHLKYGQIFWNKQIVELPSDIVNQFQNKTMAITGFEVSRYRVDENNNFEIAKVYEIYNHHWGIAISNTNHIFNDEHVSNDEHMTNEEDPTKKTLTSFGFANGNEDRLSYRGWPNGTASLIYSPTTFIGEMMTINTKNPLIDGKRVGPLPAISHAPRNGNYSGLVECPCSDRHIFDYSKQTIDGWATHFASRASLPDCLKNNTAYSINTYKGGLRCCNDGTFLTDKNQSMYDTFGESYFFRFRFYYEEYSPQTKDVIYSHVPIDSTEYDVPVCNESTYCVSTVSKNSSGFDFITDKNAWNLNSAFELVYCHAHMHVGAISLELWDITNNKNNILLCRNTAKYGESDNAFDESGYVIGFDQCVWTDVKTRPIIRQDTKLLAIALYNNTYEHRGAMSRSSCYTVPHLGV